jgi:rhodanese-related sulfurtransferase
MEEAELPEGLPVVTVCGAGNISAVAAEQLRARGYEALNTAGVDVPGAEPAVVQVRRTGKG